MSNNYWENNNEKNYWQQNQNSFSGEAVSEQSALSQFMLQTYTWMMLGLALTGIVAVITPQVEFLRNLIYGGRFVFYVLMFVELGLVWSFGSALNRGVALPNLIAMFLSYSAVNGLTLSVIFLVYSPTAIAQAFFIAAAMFGGMSLYGYVTKSDLTGVGHFARMGLWGLIVAILVNMFIHSSVLDLCVSVIGVGIFVILTAYDTQKIKSYYFASSGDAEGLKRMSLGGALILYLDFINMFLYLLRLLNSRRR